MKTPFGFFDEAIIKEYIILFEQNQTKILDEKIIIFEKLLDFFFS